MWDTQQDTIKTQINNNKYHFFVVYYVSCIYEAIHTVYYLS